jgi:hypothetical protein
MAISNAPNVGIAGDRRHNVPVPLSPLIGRVRELERSRKR